MAKVNDFFFSRYCTGVINCMRMPIPEIFKRNLRDKFHINSLTTFQEQVFQSVHGSRDNFIIHSGTGTGKTLAYLLPILSESLESVDTNRKQRLLLQPNNNLIKQSVLVARQLIDKTPLNVAALNEETRDAYSRHFQSVLNNEKSDIAEEIDLVVTTPRLFLQSIPREIWPRFDTVIVDEADFTLSPSIMPPAAKTLASLKSQCFKGTDTRFLFAGATFPLETRSESIAAQIRALFPDIKRVSGTSVHQVRFPDEFIKIKRNESKKEKLLEVIEQNKAIIGDWMVFVRNAEERDEIFQLLQDSQKGNTIIAFPALVGNESASKKRIFVGTDLMSRGTDLPNITFIINYSPPTSLTDYLHRIGRAGRLGCLNTEFAKSITLFGEGESRLCEQLMKATGVEQLFSRNRSLRKHLKRQEGGIQINA